MAIEVYDPLLNPYLDPEKLFRSRYAKHLSNSQGIERFALSVIPFALIRSFVRLDPLYVFKWSPHRVSAYTRTRERRRSSVLMDRKRTQRTTTTYWQTTSNYGGVLGKFSPIDTYSVSSSSDLNLSDNVPQRNLSWDTTKRTRPWYSHYGEFSFWKVEVVSPPRNLTIRVAHYGTRPGVDGTMSHSSNDSSTRTVIGPDGALFTMSNFPAFRQSRLDYLSGLITDQGPGILKQTLPDRREWTAFRNIVELRDVPRMIFSLKSGLERLSGLEKAISNPERLRLLKRSSDTLKDVPGHYLSYWFGWNQLYRDAVDLLKLPEKIAKRANWLLKQSGKQQTYRYKRDFITHVPMTSPFTYEGVPGFGAVSLSATRTEVVQLRCVVNAKFDFPILDTPLLRKQYLLEKLGVYPRIADIYDLIPFSWLLDWFTGVGNYLDLTEAINRDPSLFNYGFITGVIKGELSCIHKCEGTNSVSYDHSPPVGSEYTQTSKQKYRHTSKIDYSVLVRRDVSTISSVPTTSDVDSLNPFQKSILGALLLQRFVR